MLESVGDSFKLGGGFYAEGTRFIRPRPYFYRHCWHCWDVFFSRHKPAGPAEEADLVAARETFASIDQDTRDFLQLLFKLDAHWANPRDIARLVAVKSKGHRTMTGIMHDFSEANKALAIQRGLIDATKDMDEEGGEEWP